MITRYKHRSDVPYSLHDMRIEKICFEDGTISFQFANGYVSTKSPYSQVDGSLRIEKVDPDFAVVFLLSDNGYMGEFKGCKMSMDDFLRRYDDLLLFTVGIFLSGITGQEAPGVRPMWKTGQKQSYKPA